jgi:hypothetical protein
MLNNDMKLKGATPPKMPKAATADPIKFIKAKLYISFLPRRRQGDTYLELSYSINHKSGFKNASHS